MKRKIIMLLLLLLPINVFAASGSIKASSSSSKVTLNSTVTVTVKVSSSDALGSWDFDLDYDKSKLSIQSGQDNLSVREYSRDGSSTSKTYTYKFKAIKTGEAYVNVENARIGDWETEKYISTSTSNVKLTIKEPVVVNYSSDNNLKSLAVDGFKISPEFSKGTLEYNVTVLPTTTSIKINASTSDSKARVGGVGEKEVKEGTNSFDVVVTAENGSSKTYKINVVVPEKDPIKYNFKVKEFDAASKMPKNVKTSYAYKTEEFYILRKLPENIPDGFSTSSIKFNNDEVACLQNQSLNLTLIYLRDKNNKEVFYIYSKNDDSVELYNELKNNDMTIYLLDIPGEIKGMIKTTVKINEQEIEAYKIQETSKDFIVYGRNTFDGKSNYYVYNTDAKTISPFNQDDYNYLASRSSESNIYKTLTFVLSILIVLLFIIMLLINSAKKKLSKLVQMYEHEKKTSAINDKDKKTKKKVD